MANTTQALTIALFGCYAGGYTAQLDTDISTSGLGPVATSLLDLQGVLLGRNDLADQATWIDVTLGNMGIDATNAAYDAAVAWFNTAIGIVGRGQALATAIEYLLGTDVGSTFTAVATAFAANVTAGSDYSATAEGAAELDVTNLQTAESGSDVGVTASAGFNLTAALAELTAADAAAADAAYAVGELVGAANIDWDGANTIFNNLADGEDDGTDVSADELDAYASEWNPAFTAEAAADAQFIVDGIESDIADDRAYVVSGEDFNNADIVTEFAGKVLTDARLDALLAAAEAAVAGNEAASGLVDALAEAEADVAADVTANGTDAELLTAFRDALSAAIADGTNNAINSGLDVYATDSGDADVTVGSLITRISVALSDGTDAALAATVAYINTLTVGVAFNETGEPANAELVALLDRAELEAAVTTAQNNYDSNVLAIDLATAQEWVDYRDGLIEDLAAATAFNDELQAAADAQADADTAAGEALTAIEAEYDIGVIGEDSAGEGNDVFVYDGENAVSIANFGVEGNDVIKFTAGAYTLVTMAEDETATDIVGSQTAKEIFVIQDGLNTVLAIETNAFDGNATGNGDMSYITLTGVTAADVILTSAGYLTLA